MRHNFQNRAVPATGFNGGTVRTALDKPPKFRQEYKPGTKLRFKSEICVVKYAFRTVRDPHVWLFCLEEIKPLNQGGVLLMALGCGQNTPTIVYELFQNDMDATRFFSDIPMHGNQRTVPVSDLLKHATILLDACATSGCDQTRTENDEFCASCRADVNEFENKAMPHKQMD